MNGRPRRPGAARLSLLRTALLLLALAPAAVPAQQRGVVPEDYYGMTFVGDVAISPTGEYVAFTVTTVREEENDRHREVWLAPLDEGRPAGEPFRFTDPTREASSPGWSPDGRYLTFQSPRDDGPSTWLARVGAPGGEAFRLDGLEGSPVWSPDGERIAFVKRPEPDGEPDPRAGWIAPDAISRTADPERFDGRVITHARYKRDGTHDLLPHPGSRPGNELYLLPATGGEPRRLTDSDIDIGDVGWSPDGRWLAFSTNPEEVADPFGRASEIFVISAETGEVRRISEGAGMSRAPAFSPDSRRLAFLHAEGPTDPTRLMVVELRDDASWAGPPRIVSGAWTDQIGGHRWTSDGAAIRFTSSVRGTSHLWEVPAEGGPVRPVTEGARQLGSIDETPDGRWLAYTSTDATTPAEVFVARGDGSGEQRLTRFNDAWLAEVTLNPAEEITWRVEDGTEIQGWVIRPVGHDPARSYPMVLKAHGGPHGMYGHTFFQTFHVLSGAGFFVFYPNPRGSTGYGHDFAHATLGEWGLVDEEDFLTGLDAVLERYPEIDEERLGVSGGSYGGYVTNWLTGRSDRFSAAVTSRSIGSLEYLWGTSDALGTLENEFFGAPWEEPERYRAASPLNYVQNVTAPTLIIHSERDHRTPMQDAEQWFLSLERRGVPVELVRYPRSSHGLSRDGEPWLLVDRLVRLQSWFEHWLGEPVLGAPDGG